LRAYLIMLVHRCTLGHQPLHGGDIALESCLTHQRHQLVLGCLLHPSHRQLAYNYSTGWAARLIRQASGEHRPGTRTGSRDKRRAVLGCRCGRDLAPNLTAESRSLPSLFGLPLRRPGARCAGGAHVDTHSHTLVRGVVRPNAFLTHNPPTPPHTRHAPCP